jgi:SulP family sulfate permease
MSITSESASGLHRLRRPTFAELYLPKLVTVWREGYGLADSRADVFAGLTVAIVALPLSMAIAIASGVTPDRGLYTAVVGGITLAGKEPSEFVPKLTALAGGLHTINPSAFGVALVSIAIIAGLRRWRPSWPGILIAVVLAAIATAALSLPIETIGSRFGGIPRELPSPALPAFSLAKAKAVLPDAISFALLAATESLLSAVVADGMTGRRHRSNCELVAQGAANIGAALFGGICVTGRIARTATNIRAGARGPVAGMLHSVFLLLFMLVAAPLAYIPLAALASVLVVVAWTMAEKQEFATLLRSSWGDAVVLLATFLLTIFRDLTEGILVGFALGAVLFIHRMAEMTGIEERSPLVVADRPDDGNGERVPYDSALAVDRDVPVYRITGAFFFGAASAIGGVLDGIADKRKALVVDFAAVPFLDSTAANVLGRVAAKAQRQGIRLFITGASPAVRRALLTHGVSPRRARYRQTIERAVADIKAAPGATESAGQPPPA